MKRLFYLLLAAMMAANVMARNASFEIKSITHEVNVTHNKVSGLRFNVTVVINDYQYETVHCWGALYYKDNTGEWIGVPFYNQADRTYCTEDLSSSSGYITIGKSLSYHCGNESNTAQFKVFVPHNAITHPAGHVDYKISLRVQNDHYKQFVPNKSGGNTYDYYFGLNWPQELKNEQSKEQPKAQAKTAESNATDDFVDLGLPSGTLWKKKNEKAAEDMAHYPNADLEEQVGCCLPTREQFKELEKYCTWKWSGSGYIVTGQNGKSIYLPAAGYTEMSRWWSGEAPEKKGVVGFYWSSTKADAEFYKDKYYFYSLFFVQQSEPVIVIAPSDGLLWFSVRLVRNK